MRDICIKIIFVFVVLLTARNVWAGPSVNLALNPIRSGFAHPLESDSGWGGGSDVWDIVDGKTQYADWANGLAFTGGISNYVEPAGYRQATINLGDMYEFDKVVIWHHGLSHVPADVTLEFWDGSLWQDIAYDRQFDPAYVPPTEPGMSATSTPDTYLFEQVTGSKVRYSIDNRLLNVEGNQIGHGWIYEFEVCSPGEVIPSPSALILASIGVGLTYFSKRSMILQRG